MANIDPTFGLNNFNQTKVLSETETLVNNILMVLFGKPGFYPSIPALGMNIGQYLYNFADDIVYMQNHTYQIIVIDANPDSEIVNKISKLPMCRYNRHYTSDNLNHDVFILNY